MNIQQEIAAALQSDVVVKARADNEEVIRQHEAAKAAVTKAEKAHADAQWRHRDLLTKMQRGDFASGSPDQQRSAAATVAAAANAASVAKAKLADARSALAALDREKQDAERATRAAVTDALAPIANRGIEGRIAAAQRWDAAQAETRAAEADYAAATAIVLLAQREGFQLPRDAELHATLAPPPPPSTGARYTPVPSSAEELERARWNRPAPEKAAA